MPLHFHQKSTACDWHWWSAGFPSDFSVTIFPSAGKQIWSQWWQLAEIKAEHKNAGGRLVPGKKREHVPERLFPGQPPSLLWTTCSMKAGAETACRLWRSRAGKSSANGAAAAAPPSLAAPLRQVSHQVGAFETFTVLYLSTCLMNIRTMIKEKDFPVHSLQTRTHMCYYAVGKALSAKIKYSATKIHKKNPFNFEMRC